MYTIYAGNQLLFSSGSESVESIVLSPKLTLDTNGTGSLTFVLPPGNAMHGELKKLKSILTVEHDGTQIFRCRVMEIESDMYNQQSVYCEGEKAFLLDSLQEPYTYSGDAEGLFRLFITNHNAMVEEEKRFTVGEVEMVNGSDMEEVKNEYWSDTSSEIEDKLLNVYGGYLRTRTENGIHYLDWLENYGDQNTQPIEFGVNMLDLAEKADAGDVFTVLIPQGASEINEDGEYSEPLSIASVNGGLNYIQDDDAVALYGKIWRTHTWSYETDPAKLKEKGEAFLQTGVELETLTLKAVDMHFTDDNVQPIRIGDRVRIISNPHGLDRVMVCSQIELDLIDPEKTLYTFGEKPRTLTENVVRADEEVGALTGRGGGGGRKSVQEELSDIIRWAYINVDEANAKIDLNTGETNRLSGEMSQARIELDGLAADILLSAKQVEVDELSRQVSSAMIAIDGANAEIALKASRETVDDLGERVSSAEMLIDGVKSQITLKADKVEVEGLLSATQADIDNLVGGVTKAETIKAEILNGDNVIAGTLSADYFVLANTVPVFTAISMGDIASERVLAAGAGANLDLQHSHKVTVNADGTVTLGEVSSSGGSFNMADTAFYQDAVSAAQTSGYNSGYSAGNSAVTLSQGGWSYGHNVITASNGQTLTVSLPAFTTSESAWSGNKKTVYFKTGDETIAYRQVDATEIYNAGYNAGYTVGEETGYNSGRLVGREDVKNNTTVSFTAHSLTGSGSRYTLTYSVYARYNGSNIASAVRRTTTLAPSS